ncbi:hypothetical protein ACT6QH_02500 [Xanthobacter sp. TB0139]|uniref:hypothetical protein n=1 Tax=Xanthobacter sp. TB0139 TaxID=3459178 RepID=UPI00403A6F79
MLTPVPLLIIPFALYNIIVFLTPGIEWGTILGQVGLPSGISWRIRLDEAFIAITLLFFLFEILKAARINSRSFMDHTLSTLIFLIALAEFLLVPQAGTSIFALLLCVMLLDVISGITASMRAAPRREAAPRAPKPGRVKTEKPQKSPTTEVPKPEAPQAEAPQAEAPQAETPTTPVATATPPTSDVPPVPEATDKAQITASSSEGQAAPESAVKA